MKNFHIIKTYFQLTEMKKRYPFYLIITALLSDVPYMFTSLLFSYAIKFVTTGSLNEVIFTFSLYFLLKIISKLARIANYHAERLYYNASYRKLQEKILDKVGELNYDYFSNENKSRLINTINIDIKDLADFGSWLSKSLLLLISFIISIAILWKINFGLMLFGVGVNALVIYILNRYNDLYETIMFSAKEKTDKESGFFSQIMNGISEIQIFNLLPWFKKNYYGHNEAFLKEHDSMIRNHIVKNIISPAITMSAEAALMVYAVYQCLKGNFGIETVLIIQSYFGNLFSSLSELVAVLGELRLKKVSIDRYRQLIQEPNAYEEGRKPLAECMGGTIKFENVSFSFGEERVIENLNIEISPKKITGLLGDSGTGKSTIMKLVLGFLKPEAGVVWLDEYNLSEIDRTSLSKVVTMVNQEPFIFHMSIYDNLALINPDSQAIYEACKKVRIYDYIMSLPQQFQTVLKENATDLSGGQKQRLAIARALLKNAKIILLDEITSALDEKLSADILSVLEEIKEDHTILMITHRSKEYALCDEIIDLNILAGKGKEKHSQYLF